MRIVLRFIWFLLLLTFISSCSSSKRAVVHRKTERNTLRKSPKTSSSYTFTFIRKQVIRQAMEQVGSKYKYGGKSPRSGFDCSGLVSYAFQKAGLEVRGASHQQAKMGEWRSRNELQAGDLIFFGSGKKISHVAIVVNNSRGKLEVVHSTTSSGVRIDEVNHSAYWNKRFLYGKDVISGHPSFVSGN